MNRVETQIRGFIEDIQHPKQKKKININDLEFQIRQQMEDYFEMDGYSMFYDAIRLLEEEGQLTAILNKQQNGKVPSLSLFYWVNVRKGESTWDRLQMMKLSDQFDFSYYENHPEWQTDAEWQRIENIYRFLHSNEERETISIEERSLQLFGHEKFLTDEKLFPEGKGFLQRIGVTIDQIKAVKEGQPFVHWLKPGKDIKDIKRVLIVENLSFYHTCIKLMERNQLDYEPELIIYGAGKQIESSFSFFERLFPPNDYLFYYAGDIDAEGYSIFVRLKKRYDNYAMQPALKIYRKMLDCREQANDQMKQVENENDRDDFFSWFTEDEHAIMIDLWRNRKRIPQEVLTLESWGRWI